MEIYNLLDAHRSIRKFKADDVPNHILEKVAEAAIKGTSSSGNMQPFSVIITKDKKLREQLYPHHHYQDMVLEAPVLVTFCSDFNRMRLWLENNQAEENFDNFMSFMIGAIDAVLVSQSFALAAESENLGICYMGTTLANCGKIAEVLELPDNVVPVAGFALGYPDETPVQRDRLPTSGIVHFEKYNKYTEKDISDIYEQRETKGWERYMANQELREMIEKHQVKNLAQVYTTVKYTKESHIEYSNNVLECLKKHNFFNN